MKIRMSIVFLFLMMAIGIVAGQAENENESVSCGPILTSMVDNPYMRLSALSDGKEYIVFNRIEYPEENINNTFTRSPLVGPNGDYILIKRDSRNLSEGYGEYLINGCEYKLFVFGKYASMQDQEEFSASVYYSKNESMGPVGFIKGLLSLSIVCLLAHFLYFSSRYRNHSKIDFYNERKNSDEDEELMRMIFLPKVVKENIEKENYKKFILFPLYKHIWNISRNVWVKILSVFYLIFSPMLFYYAYMIYIDTGDKFGTGILSFLGLIMLFVGLAGLFDKEDHDKQENPDNESGEKPEVKQQ